MQSCSTLSVIMESRIITTMRDHYTTTRMAKIQDVTSQMPVRMWTDRNAHSFLAEVQNGAAALKDG